MKNLPHSLTSTIVNWIDVFASEKYFQLMIENFRFYQTKYKIDILAYVIMPNHFHMICNCKELRKAIQSLKSYTAKRIKEHLEQDNFTDILNEMKNSKSDYKRESEYQIWQEGFHPKQIKDYEMLNQKIEYILQSC